MALQTTVAKNALASTYAAQALYCALFTTVPGASPGTEVSGGSYARKAVTWGSPSNGVIIPTIPAISVPAGTTVVGYGYYTAATGGTYFDGGPVASQNFATAGTYTPDPTQSNYTQS